MKHVFILNLGLALALCACSPSSPVQHTHKPVQSSVVTFANTPSGERPHAIKVQCHGTTKAGAQCRRKTADVSGYCWQHNPNRKSK
jgi:hypothetical protein